MAVSAGEQGTVDAKVLTRIAGLAVLEGVLLGWWFVLRPQPAAMESMLPMGAFIAAVVAASVVIGAAFILVVARRPDGRHQRSVPAAYVAGALVGLIVGYLLQPVGGPV